VLKHVVFALIGAWVLAIGLGLHALLRYKGTPGDSQPAPKQWPVNSLIAPPADKPLLLMFAHPRCACTRASLGELQILCSKAKGEFDAAVLFFQPENLSQDWTKTELIESARAMPGLRVLFDDGGNVAKRFGVQTSGHTVLYGPQGNLLFSGGITGARGHLGDNRGLDSVLKLVGNESIPSDRAKSDVFGCSLFELSTNNQ
jgi:hypothetical protein